MTTKSINIGELKPYIDIAFSNDDDLLKYYDRAEKIKTLEEACENTFKKISIIYPDAYIIGIEIDGNKKGYFVYGNNLLISFGMNKECRNEKTLIDFWEQIREKVGDNFQCIMNSCNQRAIGFLKKHGMKPLFENVTILTNN